MQYLAVIDPDEIIFVFRETRHLIELSWQRFAPGARSRLDQPVPFETVYYSERGFETMRRLPPDFSRALFDYHRRNDAAARRAGATAVIPFPGHGG